MSVLAKAAGGMSVSRRSFLYASGGAALASVAAFSFAAPAFAAPALIGLKPTNVRTLSFNCINIGEQLNGIDYWVEGKYVPDALAEINKGLRDYESGEVLPIATNLLDLVHEIGRRLETDCRFELIGGYRSPATNAKLHQEVSGVASNSLHMTGKAVDISLPGRPLRQLYDTVLAMRTGGIGYYPDPQDEFVHVDVGRVRHWQG